MAGAEFVWPVPENHPAFAGHFPGRPIVPGVVLLDQAIRFAQRLLAGPNALSSLEGLAVPGWQIGNAKFFSPVAPGEVLTFNLEAKASGSIAFTVHGAGRDVASGSLTPPAP